MKTILIILAMTVGFSAQATDQAEAKQAVNECFDELVEMVGFGGRLSPSKYAKVTNKKNRCHAKKKQYNKKYSANYLYKLPKDRK